MASIDNRGRYQVTVKNRPDLHLTFPHNRLADLEAYIDFDAQTAYLAETKSGRPRRLSLRSDLLGLLRELPRDSAKVFPISVDALAGAWAKACSAAGLDDLHIHDCRHEGISRVAEGGNNGAQGSFGLLDLQQFSGHRDTRMLMRYAHLCSARLAKKLDECFKTEGHYRLHRGRKILARGAPVRLADVVQGALTLDTAQGLAVRESASPLGKIHSPDGASNVVHLRPRVPRARPTGG